MSVELYSRMQQDTFYGKLRNRTQNKIWNKLGSINDMEECQEVEYDMQQDMK